MTAPATPAAGGTAPPVRPAQPAGTGPARRPAHPADRATVVGYRQLWAADPGAWRVAGVAWRGLTEPVARRADELAANAAVLRGGWSGGAAGAADARLAALRAELTAASPP